MKQNKPKSQQESFEESFSYDTMILCVVEVR